ncbi:MAG: hypothetical protein AMXMBFR80_05320 [Dehalococcoidia bacterium]
MRGAAWFGATALAVLCLAAVRPGGPAGAEALLLDPGFETLDTWIVDPGTADLVENPGSGQALRVVLGIGDAKVFQRLEAQPGAGYSASLEVAGDSGVSAVLRLEFFDGGSIPIPPATQGGVAVLGSGVQVLTVSGATAPAGAAGLQFTVVLSGLTGLAATLDNATLTESAPRPTPTPEPTSTPTPAPPTSTPTTGPAPTATRTATPTRTPTPPKEPAEPRAPTPTRTPKPPKEATPTRTPTMPPTSTPTARPGSSGFGGLLANGDFEQTAGGKPVGWAKFGGEMTSTLNAARGAHAACLKSTTNSAKWLHQLVPIVGGDWYSASVSARVAGPAAASVRVSWYAAPDGSGSSLEQHDSPETASAAWSSLTTGPIQAPAAATSARIRLMLWPAGTAEACFDDAAFAAATAPAATPTPSTTPIAGPSPGVTRAVPTAPPPGGAAPAATAPSSPAALVAGQTPPAPATLRISEVVSDPAEPGRDAPYEWVELVNTGATPINLDGWSIEDASERDPLPAVMVPPGGYLLLAGESAARPPGVTAVPLPGGGIGNGLGNDGDLLRLVAPGGTVVDEMSYGDNTSVFDPAPPAPPAGRSIGVINPAADPAGDTWALTLALTPGAPNTFPPRTPSATTTRAPGATGTPPRHADPTVEAGSRGGSVAPWVVLGALAGVSGTVGIATLGPRVRQKIEARRAR